MGINDYAAAALRTDYADYTDFHSGDVSARLDYASLGLVTESAKVLDLVKKSKKAQQPLDHEAVVEELSDLLWYLNLARDELGLTFADLMKRNLTKIALKHPENDPLIRST